MEVRVKNGTPIHGESLCKACVHALIAHGYREGEEQVICQSTYPERLVPFRVRECTGYTEVKRQTLKQMEDIAWVLDTKGCRRRAGFVAPNELQKGDESIGIILNDGSSPRS
jgi:hypothetical protein